MNVRIKKLSKDAVIPEYKTSGAVGCDLSSIETVTINPDEIAFIKTGIAIDLPKGSLAFLLPRSSLALKKNLILANSVGVIDEDYKGEYIVAYRNIGKEPVILEKGERIAQILFLSYLKATFEEVDELDTSDRGEGGFGSTGKF